MVMEGFEFFVGERVEVELALIEEERKRSIKRL